MTTFRETRPSIEAALSYTRERITAIRTQIHAAPQCTCDEDDLLEYGCECGKIGATEDLRTQLEQLEEDAYDLRSDLREASGCYCGRSFGCDC